MRDKLKEPFLEKEVHWRVGATNAKKLGCKPWEATSGIPLAYIDARDVMKRLDDVVGIDNWKDEYEETARGRIICKLSIRMNDEWITKSDGAGDTATEGEKGAISDAFKRAAVKFGVGRYLYYLPATWVNLSNGKIVGKTSLPKWALPSNKPKVDYIGVVRKHLCSIGILKSRLEEGIIDHAMECWFEIPTVDRKILSSLPPSKGGIFETDEIIKIKGPEFTAKLRELIKCGDEKPETEESISVK